MFTMKTGRKISYCQALNEAFHSQMQKNKNMIIYGIEDKMFGSNEKLLEKFGNKRFFFTPLSEDMSYLVLLQFIIILELISYF